MDKKAYLILENGDIFEGLAFGAVKETVGELVFNTGMCGYIESLTDESYYGQILMQTFPSVGNYGVISEDFEGECALNGYVVREWCREPSNFRSEMTVDEFLKQKGIPGIYGVDTRAITRILRDSGVMNAAIVYEKPSDLSFIRSYKITQAVEKVTLGKKKNYPAESERFRVALIDYGAKSNIIRELLKRGCTVYELPAYTSAEEILALNPDGVMLSNGPGDPAENTFQIAEIKKLAGRLPIFGICLGHQLLALALGGKTEKLKYGHRGGNQPVKDVFGVRTYITSQNHGYAVIPESVSAGTVNFINANDGTCEGINYPNYKAFSVQFHPEACSGPHDTAFLFDRFVKLMEEN